MKNSPAGDSSDGKKNKNIGMSSTDRIISLNGFNLGDMSDGLLC